MVVVVVVEVVVVVIVVVVVVVAAAAVVVVVSTPLPTTPALSHVKTTSIYSVLAALSSCRIIL